MGFDTVSLRSCSDNNFPVRAPPKRPPPNFMSVCFALAGEPFLASSAVQGARKQEENAQIAPNQFLSSMHPETTFWMNVGKACEPPAY
eukprot:6035452-Amphidinium_carterae.1